MKRAAYCAVQMIQNVSKNRTNKLITKKDLTNITTAWSIMVPIASKVWKTMYVTTSLILVEGTGNNKCKIKWFINREFSGSGIYQNSNGASHIKIGEKIPQQTPSLSSAYKSNVTMNQELDSTYLYDDLHIKDKEIKAILEITFYKDTRNKDEEVSEILGLHILKPKIYYSTNNSNVNRSFIFTIAHVIFTPINGIFSTSNVPL